MLQFNIFPRYSLTFYAVDGNGFRLHQGDSVLTLSCLVITEAVPLTFTLTPDGLLRVNRQVNDGDPRFLIRYTLADQARRVEERVEYVLLEAVAVKFE